MGNIVKKFKDGSFLEFDTGAFDLWCVYMTDPDGTRKPPHDVDYFQNLLDFSNKYGVDKVYNAYVKVYDATGNEIDDKVLNDIEIISQEFENDSLLMQKILTILYMAMIAEENKQFTRLGKRIKRLGIHKLLKENIPVIEAANFMRGKNWKEIDELCKQRGF